MRTSECRIRIYCLNRDFLNKKIKFNLASPEIVYMKSDLDELIELCEAEKLYLENYIKDPFYNEKCELERVIEIYRKWDNLEIYSHADSYHQKQIKDNEDKLKELNKQKNKPLYDDQKIDDALFNLLNGVYKSFIFYLNIKDNLGFNFILSELNFLEISISVKNVLKVAYFFGDDDDEWSPLNAFKGLSFALNSADTKLIYKYDMKNFQDAVFVKILLSRIIYDIFTYAEFESPANLIYFK